MLTSSLSRREPKPEEGEPNRGDVGEMQQSVSPPRPKSRMQEILWLTSLIKNSSSFLRVRLLWDGLLEELLGPGKR